MGGSRRVLVVEDDTAVREMVAGYLEGCGYEVARAANAEQVLLRMSRDREPFDVVLSDIHLPGLTGMELLRLLLTYAPLRPVIMITGDTDAALARQALSYGAAGYLLKPFQLFELEAIVRQAVARLQLVESAGTLARGEGPAPLRQGLLPGAIPAAWLELADRRCGAGPGHGHRVSRIAAVLASGLPSPLAPEDRAAAATAAVAHEVGRLFGPAPTPTELASRTAQLLYDLGMDSRVLRIISHLRECWDGTGGPNGISGDAIPVGSRIVAAADAIDHDAVSRLDDGDDPTAAVAGSLAATARRAPGTFGPDVAAAIGATSSVVEAIWVLARGPVEDAASAA